MDGLFFRSARAGEFLDHVGLGKELLAVFRAPAEKRQNNLKRLPANSRRRDSP